MYEDAPVTESIADYATLLWVVAAVALLIASYVAISHLRHGTRAATLRARVTCAGLAALALGSGVWAAMLLGLVGQGLGFPLGFGALRLALAWAVAVAASAAALPLPMRWQRVPAVAAAGLLLAAGTLAAQALVVDAAGFQPGIEWRYDGLAMAGPLVASGCIGGFWVAFLAGSRRRPLKRGWRWTAAAMLAFSLLTGQELVTSAASLAAQSSSTHARQVPAEAASVVAGLVVPLALLLLQVDLRVRRAPRDRGVSLAPSRRRRVRRGPLLP